MCAFGVVLLEVPCTKLSGRTPGKALFKLKVLDKSGRLMSWSQATRRSLVIWSIGMAFGIPLLIPLAGIVAMRRVWNGLQTMWDHFAETTVVHTSRAG
jgi:uncharacterized RDD family membrane protein YckC